MQITIGDKKYRWVATDSNSCFRCCFSPEDFECRQACYGNEYLGEPCNEILNHHWQPVEEPKEQLSRNSKAVVIERLDAGNYAITADYSDGVITVKIEAMDL